MIYKIVSKVMATRLKLVLSDVILLGQYAFVLGRLIINNIIYLFECLRFMKINKPKKNTSSALKIDMMKAYDNKQCDYLQTITEKLNTPSVFIYSAY